MKKLFVLFILVLMALICQADVLQFQADCAHTGQSSDVVIVNELFWQESLATIDVFSGPVTSGNLVFVPTTIGFYCLDANNGDSVWSQEGSFTGVPAIISDRIVAVQAETLRCFKLDGNPLWSLGFPNAPSHLTIVNTIIYLTAGKKVYAVDSSGSLLWSSADLRYGFNQNMTPCCYDTFVVVATRGGGTSLEPSTVVYVLSENGRIINSVEYGWPQASNVATPTVFGSRLYLAVLPGWFPASFVYSVRLSGNTLAWRIEYNPDVVETYYASSVATEGRVFFIGEGLQAYDTTGQSLWTCGLGQVFYSSPIISAGTIWLGNDDGELIGVDGVSGLVRYRFQCGNSPLTSPVSTSHGQLIVCDLIGRVYCFGYNMAVEEREELLPRHINGLPDGIYDPTGRRLETEPSIGVWFHVQGGVVLKLVRLR